MDPGRHHEFLGNTDDRTNSRNTYYGREIPEITSHHYYGPAPTTQQQQQQQSRTISSQNVRKPCGCTNTGSGSATACLTCNGCRLNPVEEPGWPTMANSSGLEHTQRVGGMPGDYQHRMATAESTVRSNVRQGPMYVQQHPQHAIQGQPPPNHGASMTPGQHSTHPSHMASMAGSRTSYWPQSGPPNSNSGSSTHPYASAGDEHLGVHPAQTHVDISVTRRNAPAPSNDYGSYKAMSIPTNNPHGVSHSGSSSGGVSGYPLPSSTLNSTSPLHQRVSTMGGVGATHPGPTNANIPYMSKEQRIYESHQKYSTTSSAATAKMSYNTTPASAMYDSHHHHLNSTGMSKTLPIDHHVINPSNLPTPKEQHPSPNYARKCPQMYATPEEQSTAHQHLYMSTPQFSSDKFTRASPQQPPPPTGPPSSDYTKLRESPSGSAYMVAPHSDKYVNAHMHSSHLRESPQFPPHSTTASPRNPSSYYGSSSGQNPSKIHPPEMSPIIMKQSHHPTHHYQYSKSPLPPPLPPSHMQQPTQTIPPPTSQIAAKSQSLIVGPPPPPGGHSQRYMMDNVKREDLEIYETTNQTSSRHSAGSGIYINPYNTPPPTGDNCCKEVALSTSSSPYTTGSATPNYRVESPQFYPTKYAKLAMNESLSSSKHSLINQNTPPPSRAPSQRGQHQANYYYEGNSHSAPSPAAATAASPSPSALLTTTSQTPMHHTEYMSSPMPPGPNIGPPPSQLVGANMPQSYASQPSLAAQQHHLPHHLNSAASAALRNNDLMITVQPTSTHPSYERAIHHPSQQSSVAPHNMASQHLNSKHVLTHPSSTSSSSTTGPISSLQMPMASSSSNKPVAKHQKPNYRELINQKLAIRNATSEEELNMQIIKKTLNVESPNIRAPPSSSNQLPLTGSNRGVAAMPTPHLQATERIPSVVRDSSGKTNPLGSVLVTHKNSTLPLSSTARVIEIPEAMPQRICIKQEDEKPSSSSGPTSSSPLDLSMRTVKTKADSTDYKYQQRPRLPNAASSTTSSEGRYTLPRVDSTPVFSVHAFEPGAAAAAASVPVSSRQSGSRHSSLDRRNYTPPTQQQHISQAPPLGPASGATSYPPSSSQHIPASSTHHPYPNNNVNSGGSSRRPELSNNNVPARNSPSLNCYENSLVIKTAPKLNNLNSDLVVRPSNIAGGPPSIQQTNAQTNRPSVLETNPYATVIKTENKRFNETPPSSPHHTLAAVERLPPDTSIMALPARNPYGVVRSAIQTNHTANISSTNPPPTQSNYSLACEKNPNFLGRKRHLQEYSNQKSLIEPEIKHKRYMDSTPPPMQTQASKPQIPMRPADISVIAVNEVSQEGSLANKPRPGPGEVVASLNSTSVIASTTNNLNNLASSPKVIVNNVNVSVEKQSPTSSSVLVVCKKEPLTPTGDTPNTPSCNKTPEMPVNSFTARIRTKAELKGFTFNPPPPPPVQTAEISNAPGSPAKVVTIKQEEPEEHLIPVVKIKEEIVQKIELPLIPGLDDGFEEKSLLDFGWSNTCNNFMEQLLTRPSGKKKTAFQQITNSKPVKDPDMVVTSSEAVASLNTTRTNQENHQLSTIESADNTTRSSFTRLEAGVDSSMNFNNLNQDSLNSQGSGFVHKKLSKTEREKKRYHQEQRLAERLKAKESSSESEDELDKRKTERLKKPPMKQKNKLNKSPKPGTNSSSSPNIMDKLRFSDCGSDSTSTEIGEKKKKALASPVTPIKLEIKKEIIEPEEQEEHTKLEKGEEKLKNNDKEKCDIKLKVNEEEEKKNLDKNKKKSWISKAAKDEKQISRQETKEVSKKEEFKLIKEEAKSSSESTDSEDEEEEEEDEEEEEEEEEEETKTKVSTNKKGKFGKQLLNTMTRSKRKQELEQQLANSKVLRNDKVIRNFSSANSSNKIKRKYTRKYNTVNSLLESGGLSRESGIMKSTRLKAKLERNGGKLNLIKNNKNKLTNNNKLQNSKDMQGNKLKDQKPENVHERNVIDLYRFKRALKVPPSLINIKHPGAHKIAASLPDLERHAEALEAYAKKREKNKINNLKLKSAKGAYTKIKAEKPSITSGKSAVNEEPKSIIDLLHSRVTKASGIIVRNKTTTTTAINRPTKPCCTTSSNNSKAPSNNSNCGMFSETSQTTESSELQMLPELKKDSDMEEDNDDNDSTNGKKRHFSIFDTKVLPTKTRTESKLQQKKENIREIFVGGDDRPASAPPEITQVLDSSEKFTFEQTYEQFLQQMNIVVSADTLGRLGGSKKRASSTANGNQDLSSLNIKQEADDTESTSVIDADDLKEDHKSLPNHFRKRRGKYLRRKGSSGFDYIRKKKKPSSANNNNNNNANSNGSHFNHLHNGPLSNLPQYSIKSEKYEMDEYEHKIKTEDDVSREIQKWVLNKGVGQSTMHKAARQGYIDVIVYCLDRMGMNPDQKDNAGYTPLHEACTNGWLNIARVLLQYGANHSEAAHSGIRPLHEASENDHEEIVRLLLSYGADPLLATYSGQTPLMLASSKTMRDILSNHLVDVQSMGPERKPWRFNGPWEIYDPSEYGYNVFEGAPNTVCDMSRALLRRGSLTNNQMMQKHKNQQQLQLQNVLNANNATTSSSVAATATTATTTASTSNTNSPNSTNTSATIPGQSAILNNSNNAASATNTAAGSSSCSGSSSSTQGIDNQQQQQQLKIKGGGEINTKTVMEKCAVVLDNIDRFNSVRLYNDNKPEILVENSDSDGEMFEFEEADVLLPPLYLLKDEGTQDKWVLLNDLCNLLKVKSKDTLLNKIYPSNSTSSPASVASAHKSLMRELKMSDFLEKATCLQLLCAGEKLNICASKVVLIKYNENVRNLLGVKTILMKF